MDVCVVLYHCDATRLTRGLRTGDRLVTIDNTVTNRGFSAGANLAFHQGTDNLVCFVNPDGEFIGDCLDRLEQAFQDPDVVAAGPDLGSLNQPLLADGTPTFLSGCCLAVRRSAMEEVGGFDERLFMYCEDVDLCLKLARLGRLVRVSDAGYRHDRVVDKPFLAFHRQARNHMVVMQRHRGHAGVARMIRDAAYSLRRRRFKHGTARLTAVIEYVCRAHRWA